MPSCLRPLLLALVLVINASSARALEGATSFTIDLPFNTSVETPAWLGQPVTTTNSFASLELPILPPDPNAALLVTVFFREQNGGLLRISWQAAAATAPDDSEALPGPGEAALSSVLSENFYEGIGMSNQRSLLVPAEAMRRPGSLIFQTGSASLAIHHIELQWLENAVGLNSPAINDVLVTPADGPTQPASALAGQPPGMQDPEWRGRIVDVPVTSLPLRIEQGVDFAVQIDSVPSLARLALKEAGLPWGQHLVVWLNNQRAGVVVPGVPPLANGGFGASTNDVYVGWRESTVLLPSALLRAGANALQFSTESDVPQSAPNESPAAPLAVKDVLLQLSYPPAVTAPAGLTATASSTSTSVASTTAVTTATQPPAIPADANPSSTTTP